MTQFTSLHLAISDKLGWGDMLVEIALPAIDRMVNNYIGHVSDVTGDILSEEDALAVMAERFTADDIFSLLASPYYPEWEQMRDDLINLRGEIEEYMRRGYNYQEAIAEWFK